MKRTALATPMVVIAAALTAWAQQLPPMPGAPEYPQGDPRSPQSNQGPPAYNGSQQGPDNGPDDPDADAPDRGVARIAYMNGNVSVRRGDNGELVAAAMNAPLTIGDRLVTGDGRAEIQFDSAHLLRLGQGTEVRLSELQYHRYQIQVAAGLVSFRVLRDSDAQVEISTPSISIRPVRRGVYRINIRPDGTTEITLRGGAEGEVFGPRGSEQIHNNTTMMVRGNSSDPEFQMSGMMPEDEFDRWAGSRDAQFERSVSSRYVPQDVYGAEDLDGNGRWVQDPQYGQVWQPTAVDPGWAPYQCGRWVWMDYYGWTWVGCESWGWAPYHYGRWFYGSAGWCWWPGSFYGRYYWRPALVGFFGWGGGFGVGWFPLGPYERYHPWYGRGYLAYGYRGGYAAGYRNARFATGIRAGEFGHGFVNRSNIVHADVRSATSFRGQLPFSRSQASTQFTNRGFSNQGMPRTSDNTRFFSRQQGGFSNRTASPAPSNNGGGWQRMNPGQGGRVTPSAPSNNGGNWQRFEGNRGGGNYQAPQNRGGHSQSQPRYESQPRGGFNQSQPRYEQSQPRGGYSQPSQRNFSQPRSEPQQLRINPPIVQNRGNSGGGAPSHGFGGGGSRPSGGGGGGAPRSSGGGGGNHGGGGGHGRH